MLHELAGTKGKKLPHSKLTEYGLELSLSYVRCSTFQQHCSFCGVDNWFFKNSVYTQEQLRNTLHVSISFFSKPFVPLFSEVVTQYFR